MTDETETQMTTVPLWSLTEDTLVEIGDDDAIVVMTRWGEFEIAGDELVAESLRRMALGPVSLDNAAAAGPTAAPDRSGLHRALDQLSGSVVWSLGLNDGQTPLLSVVPADPDARFAVRPIGADTPVRLSGYAAIRPAKGAPMVESPCVPFRALLSRPLAVRIVCSLVRTSSAGRIAAELKLPEPLVSGVLAYLVAAGVVVTGDERGEFAEDTDSRYRSWTYHEMLFHTRGRGRTGYSQTGSEGTEDEPPLVKTVPGGVTVSLYRPDLAGGTAADDSVTGLLETDHVCPAFSAHELAAERVGELLFRGARVRSIEPSHLPGPPRVVSQRPYFNIACLYELELYLAIHRCRGIAEGIYHYDPAGHALTLVNDTAADRTSLLDLAMVAGGGHRRPAATLAVTVRMERTARAFDGAAYATALTHFGALQQTLYLVAKAIGLAVHAVPLDSGYRMDRALKLRWLEEATIGVCVLDVAD